jgi:CRP/FNR family transcriptional regulator, cyclic AMP receptor protein
VAPSGADGRQIPHPWPDSSLLAELSVPDQQELLGLGTTLSYTRPRILVREGEDSTHAILLRSAIAKITGRTENGRETLLAIRGSGDIVGELAALDRMPRSATVATCGPAEVDIIKGNMFEAFLRRTPAAAIALNRMTGSQLRAATRRRVELGGYPVRVRLAHMLAELAAVYGRADQQGVAISVALTQKEIGELVAASDVAVHKALRKLKRAGLIATGYRTIIVRDLAALVGFTE